MVKKTIYIYMMRTLSQNDSNQKMRFIMEKKDYLNVSENETIKINKTK